MSPAGSSPESSPNSFNSPLSAEELQEAIRKRAEEIYVRKGKIPGHDLENWAEAELEIMQELQDSQRRAAVVIELEGVQYLAEYDPDHCDGYSPGEFQSGNPVPVRFEGQKMFLRRPNGRELETLVVDKRNTPSL